MFEVDPKLCLSHKLRAHGKGLTKKVSGSEGERKSRRIT